MGKDNRPTQPNDIDAERSVIGAMLLEKEACMVCLDDLVPDDFYNPALAAIFRVCKGLSESMEPVDEVTISSKAGNEKWFESLGFEFLTDLVESVPTAANVEYYIGIVKNKSLGRRILSELDRLKSDVINKDNQYDVSLDRINSTFSSMSSVGKKRDPVSSKKLMSDIVKKIELANTEKGSNLSLSSGFLAIDKITGGLRKGSSLILAGRPSMGKSAFALNIAQNVTGQDNASVLFFSLEMSETELGFRQLSSQVNIDSRELEQCTFNHNAFPRILNAVNRLSMDNIYYDSSSSIDIMGIRRAAFKHKSRYGLDLIIIDYLQLMESKSKGGNREQEISSISRGIKNLARELEIPIVTLSQLSRALEQRQNKRPILSDLRESGSIEQDADAVIFIYRENYYLADCDKHPSDPTEIIIAKNRHGPNGKINLVFSPTRIKFLEEKRDL